MLRGLLVILCACSAAPVRTANPHGAGAWEAIGKKLPGRWIATTDGATVPVEFRYVARESVLLETFGNPGRETVTTYHADGNGMVATHYCAQGNQPRLRMQSGDARHPHLALADVTGQDAGESVLVELSFDLTAEAGFERVEVYRQPDGKLERTVWKFAPAP
jgi:hypothetical protein